MFYLKFLLLCEDFYCTINLFISPKNNNIVIDEGDLESLNCRIVIFFEYLKMFAEYKLAEAKQHRGSRNTEKAVSILQDLCNEGNAEAMYQLGQLIYENESFDHTEEDAIELYEKASVQGHVGARVALGNHYFEESDTEKAIHYYKLANNEVALHSLGSIYRDGIGVPQDTDKAEEYFKKAAAAGYEESKEQLSKKITINIDNISLNKMIKIDIDPSNTILQLKQMIAKIGNISQDEQKLILDGEILQDLYKISDYNRIQEGITIKLEIIRTGKIDIVISLSNPKKEIDITVDLSTTIHQLKEHLFFGGIDIPVKQQLLTLTKTQRQLSDDNKTLYEYNIQNKSRIQLEEIPKGTINIEIEVARQERKFSITVNKSDIILDIKNLIYKMGGYDFKPEKQRLSYEKKILSDNFLVSHYNIKNGSILGLFILEDLSIIIKNKSMDYKPDIPLKFSSDSTIIQIKEEIEKAANIPVKHQKLSYNSKRLRKNSKKLEDYGININGNVPIILNLEVKSTRRIVNQNPRASCEDLQNEAKKELHFDKLMKQAEVFQEEPKKDLPKEDINIEDKEKSVKSNIRHQIKALNDPRLDMEQINEEMDKIRERYDTPLVKINDNISRIMSEKNPNVKYIKVAELSTSANEIQDKWRNQLDMLKRPEKWLKIFLLEELKQKFKFYMQRYLEEHIIIYRGLASGNVDFKNKTAKENFFAVSKAKLNTKVHKIGIFGLLATISSKNKGSLAIKNSQLISSVVGESLTDNANFAAEFSDIMSFRYEKFIGQLSLQSLQILAQIIVEQRIPLFIYFADKNYDKDTLMKHITSPVFPSGGNLLEIYEKFYSKVDKTFKLELAADNESKIIPSELLRYPACSTKRHSLDKKRMAKPAGKKLKYPNMFLKVLPYQFDLLVTGRNHLISYKVI